MNRNIKNRNGKFGLEKISQTGIGEGFTPQLRTFRKMMFAGLLLIAFVGIGLAKGKENQTKFFYNNNGAKELSDHQTVCVMDKNDLYLIPQVKYFFEYDENDRVIEKSVLKWDPYKKDWIQSCMIKFTYTDDSLIVELAYWNPNKRKYDQFTERAIYQMDANLLTSYSHYQRGSMAENWNMVLSFSMNEPASVLSIAKKELIADAKK